MGDNRVEDNKHIEAYLKELGDLERDYLNEVLSSRRTAWRVVWGLGALLSCSIIANVTLIPLHEKVPYLLEKDAVGNVQVLAAITDEPIEQSKQDSINQYFLRQYVLNREAYDWQLQQSYYDKVMQWSSGTAKSEYNELYGDDGIDGKLRNSIQIHITVKSVDAPSGQSVATVRYERKVKDMATGRFGKPTTHIATMEYGYDASITTMLQRYEDPLNFKVYAYRSVSEM